MLLKNPEGNTVMARYTDVWPYRRLVIPTLLFCSFLDSLWAKTVQNHLESGKKQLERSFALTFPGFSKFLVLSEKFLDFETG